MNELKTAWEALAYGGAMVYPLLALGVLAVLIILDRAAMYFRCLRMPSALHELIETWEFSWADLERQLDSLGPRNAYARFFRVIVDNRTKPAWWVESRAGDEAGGIEKALGRGLWVLETVVTAAPLMGLLGPGGADAGDVGRRAGADRNRAGPADSAVRAVRLQLFRAHSIACARFDGAAGIAFGRSYPPRPGKRRHVPSSS